MIMVTGKFGVMYMFTVDNWHFIVIMTTRQVNGYTEAHAHRFSRPT